MGQENRLDHLEDSRFKEIRRFKKKELPHQLYWYLKQDYFSEELLGIYRHQVDAFKRITTEAFTLFEKATDQIINNNLLGSFDIPDYFQECLVNSWQNRERHPFLVGRFDINGGLKNDAPQIIEFNADTCSTLPETILWQTIQGKQLGTGMLQFNELNTDMGVILSKLKANITHDTPFLLGSSLGYKEDILNVNMVLDIAHENGFRTFYTDLEHVIFSHQDGILYEINGEYQLADLWFKLIPWDWMFTEEPELAKDMVTIIEKGLCGVLNPPYTALWQNKKMLAFITENFPNTVIADTFLEEPIQKEFVVKPIFGRLGENIEIRSNKPTFSKGDYANQQKVYQNYHPLNQDNEGYHYQTGIFFTNKPSALNLRTEASQIITDDCEFMSHFII